ncbi:ABC transporter substrate-binding protein [Roseibium sp. AS2]|uniref:ABC transporter substrate-binding protein n=1 Tax=Roseibium sp. AS2 TaxID=3135781 RepID=UPI003179CAEA
MNKALRDIEFGEQGNTAPETGGVLELLGPGGPDHIDTASAYYATSGQILRALTRQLFAYPATHDLSDAVKAFTPAADIAETIPTTENGGISADGRVVTIKLREGVRWDTTPPREVTAEDIIRGLKRLPNPVSSAGALHYFTSTIDGYADYAAAYEAAFEGKPATAAGLADFQNSHEIAGLEALDDKTLRVTLVTPANDILNILAMGFASPAPVEYDAYLPDSPEMRANHVSNGPYRFASSPDDPEEIRLERNPAWLQDSDPIRQQNLDGIRIRIKRETPETLRGMIDRSEADLAWSFTVVSWAKPEPERIEFPRSYPGFALNPYLVFNMHSQNAGGAIGNLNVRQAIAYAVDKVAISDILSVMQGVPNKPLHSAIPPGSTGHRPFNPYPSEGDRGDREKARELLSEAGYGDGIELIAAVRDVKLHLDVMGSVARDLEACGIRLRFEKYSQADYYGSFLSTPDNARSSRWDIAEPGWTPDWFGNNGRSIVQPMFQTNNKPGTTNYGGYSNPDVDRMIAEALRESDLEKAEALWHEIDIALMKDLPIVPILAFAAMTSRYHSPRVRNAVHVPQIEFFDITNLWLDRRMS